MEAMQHRPRRQARQPLGGPLDLGDAGQEGEQAALAPRPARGGSRRPSLLDPAFGDAAEMAQRERMARPSLSTTGAPPISAAKRAAVERRRHRDQPQIRPQTRLRIEREREAEIAVQAAFMDLVEQHRGDAGQFRIGLDAATKMPSVTTRMRVSAERLLSSRVA